MRIIHTPGHAIGHCCLYFPADEILYLGDIDLGLFGSWYGDRVSSIDQTINSIDTVVTIPARVFITSHETGIIGGDMVEPAERHRAVINERETALVDFLDKPGTFGEIICRWITYKKPREPLKIFNFMESAHIRKHLERLLRNEKIRFENGMFSVV